MTDHDSRMIAKLEVIVDMGDPQLAALANVIIEFISGKPVKQIGYHNEETNHNG